MRTTIDLDDDVLAAVQEQARRERSSAGRVLSRLARDALTGTASGERGRTGARSGVPLLPSRGGILTNELIDRLREQGPE